ncbi:MAG: efflux RND transporter periplasmic adaptor subunit [Flavisolibacter sp.]
MPGEIQLSEHQIQIANIQLDTISKNVFADRTVLAATINFNEKNVKVLSSRISGRIDKLYYKNIGDYIAKGAKIYELYSEELNNAKQQYLLLMEKRKTLGNTIVDFDQLLQSSKAKLFFWGMSQQQISSLEQRGSSSLTTTFYSTASGYLTTLDIDEGNYVAQGGLIMHLANLESVWAEAQVFSSQLSQLNPKAEVNVQIPELPNKLIKGHIDFINPEINTQTRINLVRVNLSNPTGQLKPGMAAYIELSNHQVASLSLPLEAVIRTSNMSHVWVMTNNNKFKLLQVQTGTESGNKIEIINGLKQGDAVVVSGAYLLNSEYLLRNGGNSMEGMKM